MNERERLIELLYRAHHNASSVMSETGDEDEAITVEANYLLANGVTVQRWIPVKDERKPKHGDIALCYMTFEEFKILQWDDRSKVWVGDYMDYNFESVAYWQMPQPPKEV